MKQKLIMLDEPFRTPESIRICTWHESGQGYLHMLWRKDGICALCLERIRLDLMKHAKCEWPRLLQEGRWEQFPGAGYFPRYSRVVGDCTHDLIHVVGKESETGWRVIVWNTVSGLEHGRHDGELTECLQWSDERI